MTTLTIGKQFANEVADYISSEMFSPHRGVIEVQSPFGGSCIAAFGNDGYRQDGRTRAYVDTLLEELGRLDPVLGIDSDEGYTWAIVVPMDDLFLGAVIECELYARYRESRGLADDDGFVILRKAICDREIIEHTNGEPLAISGWESVN
jgi:hypothetical protein